MKTKHPESYMLPSSDKNTMRQYDEILYRCVELKLPWTLTRLMERCQSANIGKLYKNMTIRKLPPENREEIQGLATAEHITGESLKTSQKNSVAILLKVGDRKIVRLIQVNYNSYQDLEYDAFYRDIFSNKAFDIQRNKEGLQFRPNNQTKGKAKNETGLIYPVNIINIKIDNQNKRIDGLYEVVLQDDVVQNSDSEGYQPQRFMYAAIILKRIIHSRTEEVFYKVYIINRINGLNDERVITISKDTFERWKMTRSIQVLMPQYFEKFDDNIIISEEDLSVLEDVGKDAADIPDYIGLGSAGNDIDDFEISDESDEDCEPSCHVGLDDLAKILDQGGIKYAEAKDLQLGIGTSWVYDNDGISFVALEKACNDQESSSIYNKYTPKTDSFEELSSHYSVPTDNMQSFEEYLRQCIGSGVLETGIGNDVLDDNFVLRIYELNANKVVESIIESGLFDIEDFPNGLKSQMLSSMKKEAFEFCEGLYPPGIELSLVDMLSVYRILVPYFFNTSRRYVNYLRSCYSSDGTKCNVSKRDSFIQAVPISVFNSIDMNQKTAAKDFICLDRKYNYSLEGKTYKLNFIAKSALTGFEQCFRGLVLGNRYSEEPDYKKPYMLNKVGKDDAKEG